MGEEGERKKGRGEGEGDENTSKFVLVLTYISVLGERTHHTVSNRRRPARSCEAVPAVPSAPLCGKNVDTPAQETEISESPQTVKLAPLAAST